MAVNFYDKVDDNLLKFAVIVTKTDGKYVFCKHKQRSTFEIPGGHREAGENIIDTAKRELIEETGAFDFNLKPVCVYSVTQDNAHDKEETFGLLCYAEVFSFGEIDSEIEKIIISDSMPTDWTYPDIQPFFFEELKRRNII